MPRGEGMVPNNGEQGGFVKQVLSPVGDALATGVMQDRAFQQLMLQSSRGGMVSGQQTQLTVSIRVRTGPVPGPVVSDLSC